MKILCVFGEHQYGNRLRGLGTEYSAFIPALKNLGHEVIHFESWNTKCYKDLAELNQRLLEKVELCRPDIMLTIQRNYELWLETLDIIRARGDVATISWTTDDSWKYREVSRFIGHSYHAMTTTYKTMLPKYNRVGISNVLLSQWGVSSFWLKEPTPASQCKYQVSFIGATQRYRLKMIRKLEERGIEVSCFGYGWPNGAIDIERIPQIINDSVISINFANSKTVNQIKARTFEVTGSGGFLLTEYSPDLENYYHLGKEIVVFKSLDDLVEKIRYYLSHETDRNTIADAGFQRTKIDHTYEKRLAPVLDFALKAMKRTPVNLVKPVFDKAKNNHILTPPLRLLRKTLNALFILLFGINRGPRAARRFLFEFCYRVMGRHTFTASGWPGRIYPHN